MNLFEQSHSSSSVSEPFYSLAEKHLQLTPAPRVSQNISNPSAVRAHLGIIKDMIFLVHAFGTLVVLHSCTLQVYTPHFVPVLATVATLQGFLENM